MSDRRFGVIVIVIAIVIILFLSWCIPAPFSMYK